MLEIIFMKILLYDWNNSTSAEYSFLRETLQLFTQLIVQSD